MDHRTKIREFVTSRIRSAHRRELVVSDGDSIVRSGLLNSITIVEIITFVEKEFGVNIADGDIHIDDFDSIDRICNLVERNRVGLQA